MQYFETSTTLFNLKVILFCLSTMKQSFRGALGLCRHGAMESTGIYWRPIYEILEDAYSVISFCLSSMPDTAKNVPGKKTDIRDSEWIATPFWRKEKNAFLSIFFQ